MREMTLAVEDSRYGVQLQGEPDNERLGKRLKADFKRVAPAVKALSSEQLAQFQQSGEITVEGHLLTTEDIRVGDISLHIFAYFFHRKYICAFNFRHVAEN